MADTVDPSLFPPGRVPAGASPPRRCILELPDGYGTVTYVHDPPGGAAPDSSAGGPVGAGGAVGLPVLYLHGIPHGIYIRIRCPHGRIYHYPSPVSYCKTGIPGKSVLGPYPNGQDDHVTFDIPVFFRMYNGKPSLF